jgi:uncharacterized protein
VMGVDPGFRTGCKLVVLDETGKLLKPVPYIPPNPWKKLKQPRKQ